jgi:hypothetical protein
VGVVPVSGVTNPARPCRAAVNTFRATDGLLRALWVRHVASGLREPGLRLLGLLDMGGVDTRPHVFPWAVNAPAAGGGEASNQVQAEAAERRIPSDGRGGRPVHCRVGDVEQPAGRQGGHGRPDLAAAVGRWTPTPRRPAVAGRRLRPPRPGSATHSAARRATPAAGLRVGLARWAAPPGGGRRPRPAAERMMQPQRLAHRSASVTHRF